MEIATTNPRPDLVLWSPSNRSVYIIELTVPWEDNVGEAYERKKLRYAELAADAKQRGWKATVLPVEEALLAVQLPVFSRTCPVLLKEQASGSGSGGVTSSGL